jgi:glucosamine-6-phosphate deaminase
MRFFIRDDAAAASVHVANYIVDRINHFAPTPAHRFVLGLPTGGTPLGVYRVLVEKYKAGEVRQSKAVTLLGRRQLFLTQLMDRSRSRMSSPSTW